MQVKFSISALSCAALVASLWFISSASPQPLVANGDFRQPLAGSWNLTGKSKSGLKGIEVQLPGIGAARGVQVELEAAPGANPWDARLVAPFTALPVAKNDVVLIQFWGRSTPKTSVNAIFQQGVTPFTKTIRQNAALRPEWRQFTFYGPALASYAAGETNFELQIGQATGTVEIAGIRVENLGKRSLTEVGQQFGGQTVDYYGNAEVDDSWIPAAQARIEKIRKADLQVTVVDAAGRPVPNANIVLKQTRSAFRWGTAVNHTLLADGPDCEQYREKMKLLFNSAVIENDLKWRATDGRPEVQARAKAMVDWLRANDMAVRGHTVVWGSARYLPDRLKDLPVDTTRAEVKQRVFDAMEPYRGQLYVWDVVNEAATNTDLWEKLGWNTFADVYRWAREADPGAKLAYNDYNISNEAPDKGAQRIKVDARIKFLLDSGAPVDILGDQAHIDVPLTPIPRVLEIWNEWGTTFKKPIEITEFDVNVLDDKVHEKYVRDYMTAAFSNPHIESFLLWGFWEKAHWRGLAGSMYRADWSPRPAALAYQDLVLNQWRTNVATPADANGGLRTRGFLGDYEVSVSSGQMSGTAQFVLGKEGAQVRVVVR